MSDFNRRSFLRKSALAGLSTLVYPQLAAFQDLSIPKFKMSLNPGAIGVSLPQKVLLDMASKYGFKAIVPDPEELAGFSKEERAEFVKNMKRRNLSWDSTNLPVQFRGSEDEFQKGLKKLPDTAKTLQQVGATRMNTWIMPTHKTLTYRENFQLHTLRLREAADISRPYGIRLGLEYVGPKTLMARDKFAFIRTMKECQELIAEIESPNVGLQLDAFHWYCAGETVEDIMALKPENIVTVDLNDAVAGRTADEQLDWERELPTNSGVIDLAGFLKALRKIGYEGPVRAEPFNERLNKMDTKPALAATFKAMQRAFIQSTD